MSSGKKFDLLYLHGFWGRGAEAPEFLSALSRLPDVDEVLAPDLLVEGPLGPESQPSEWAKQFAQTLPGQRKIVLVGYSMGARLGMHLLLERPQLFAGAVFLSSRLGGLSEVEKTEREKWQQQWTERFQQWPWEQLEQAWNEQELFSGQVRGLESRCRDRQLLTQALQNWSLLRHSFAPKEMSDLTVPQLWLVGERDTKYLNFTLEAHKKNWIAQSAIVENAGHRLPFEAPMPTAEALGSFIRLISH